MAERVDFAYDIALSFAGEDRPYVAKVAAALQAAGVNVFYDEYVAATLWGKDLYTHLRDVYQNQARFTLLFVSEHYAKKVWTNHERESAQARAINERTEYILPARFDDSSIPGLLHTTGYIDLRRTSPDELATLILQKLGRRPGTWEVSSAGELPRDAAPQSESIRERAARLAAQHRVQANREELLASMRGVQLAQAEAANLFQYIQSEVSALKEADPDLDIRCMVGADGVLLVRSPRASFTMYWGQSYANTLREASLFTREFDGPHSLDGLGGRRRAADEVHVRFDVNDELRPVWHHDESPAIGYNTQQLADRYLSRVIERAYRATVDDDANGYGAEDDWDDGWTIQ